VFLQGFFAVCQCARCLFRPVSAIFQPASAVSCTCIWHAFASGALPGGVAVRRAPKPGPG
jgi:hypothetical protein